MFEQIEEWFQERANSAPNGIGPQKILDVPDNDKSGRVDVPFPGIYTAEELIPHVDDLIGRLDTATPQWSGADNFWSQVEAMIQPDTPQVGPNSFESFRNRWYDRSAGPAGPDGYLYLVNNAFPTQSEEELSAFINNRYWDANVDYNAMAGLGSGPTYGRVWYEQHLELVRAVQAVYPHPDTVEQEDDPVTAPAARFWPVEIYAEVTLEGPSENRQTKSYAYRMNTAELWSFDRAVEILMEGREWAERNLPKR